MKRSDMVEVIKQQLFGDSNYPGHKDEAAALLSVIEGEGMVPPQCLDCLVTGECSHEWESET